MFELKELLKATAGKLLGGAADGRVKGISTDSRTIKKGEAFVALKGDNFDGHVFVKAVAKKGARAVIVDHDCPGLGSTAVIKVPDTTRALGAIAHFHRNKFTIPVIAVTGSNGKTTTKDMLAWVLSKELKVLKNEGTKNNHIGVPQTLLKLDNSYKAAVIEMGTNHFGEIAYLAGITAATAGIITNIGPSHLEHFHSLAGVSKEKRSLLGFLESPRLAILNADDEYLRKEVLKNKKRPFAVGYGIKKTSDFTVTKMRTAIDGVAFTVANRQEFLLKTVGRYNVYNALAVIAAARILGMEYKDIARRLREFVFPAGRLNYVRRGALTFIDDTYNSNPFSLACALDSLERLSVTGRKIFVMGDMRELGRGAAGFHRSAGQNAARICDVFVAVGPLSKAAASAARACSCKPAAIFSCESSVQARDILFKRIQPQPADIILVKGSRSMKMEEVFKTHAL
jgi:UDP-N-acetylmuramoyl-tripeptide--D-alanyl-D-alanine ligase